MRWYEQILVPNGLNTVESRSTMSRNVLSSVSYPDELPQEVNPGDEKLVVPGGMNSDKVASTLSTVEEEASFDA